MTPDEKLKELFGDSAVFVNGDLIVNVAQNIAVGPGASVDARSITLPTGTRNSLVVGGVDYRHSHCEPLASELHTHVDEIPESDYYKRVFRDWGDE